MRGISDKLYYVVGTVIFIWLALTQPFPLGCQNISLKGSVPNWASEFQAERHYFVVSKGDELCREEILTAEHANSFKSLARARTRDLRLDQYIANGTPYFVLAGSPESYLKGGNVAFTFDLESCKLVASQIRQLQPQTFR